MLEKPAVKNGLLLAAVWIVIYAAMYFINPELLFNTGISLAISLLIPIYFIRKAILEEREINEGMLSLGEGFVAGILVYFIGALLYFAVQGVHMFNDAKFKADGERISMEMAEKGMQKVFQYTNIPEEEQEKAIAELKANPPTISPAQMVIGFLVSLIFPGAIIAIIAAAALKKG